MEEKTEHGESNNSLAAWNLVCQPKNKGGLGILDIQIQNTGLLLKFLHNFYNKNDVPWVNLIWTTFYEGAVPHAQDPCGSFWWRDVMSLSDTYRGITQIEVHDGDTALFWKDLWTDQLMMDSHMSDVWKCTWGPRYTSAGYYKLYFENVQVDEAFPMIWKSRCTMKL